MNLTDYLSPLLRPLSLSGPKRLYVGIWQRPDTLNRPKGAAKKQKRDYITDGFSVENNVLNLNTYNLIGVFGPPEDREALLLTPQGQLMRLKVGSQFDKGTVISIGKSEMIYIRNNNNYVLRMNN